MYQHEATNAGSQEGKHFGMRGESARNLDFEVYALLDTLRRVTRPGQQVVESWQFILDATILLESFCNTSNYSSPVQHALLSVLSRRQWPAIKPSHTRTERRHQLPVSTNGPSSKPNAAAGSSTHAVGTSCTCRADGKRPVDCHGCLWSSGSPADT
jgi:hypothetical protein